MKAEFRRISPAQARKWLALPRIDRDVDDDQVGRLARDMVAGTFVSGMWDAVAFDVKERLRNGQHRLLAIVKSNTTQTLLVVWGIPDGAYEVGDQGRKRTLQQTLKMQGYPDPGTLAPALRLTTQWLKGYRPGDRGAGRAKPTTPEALATLGQHGALLDLMPLGRRISTHALLGSKGGGTFLAWLLLNTDPSEAEGFFDRICDTSGHQRGEATLALRDRLLKMQAEARSTKGSDVTYKLAIAIKAFNLWRRGEEVQQLGWRRGGQNPEPFPLPDPPESGRGAIWPERSDAAPRQDEDA